VKFLGYIISGDGIHMDPCKVQTIVDWATLTSIRNDHCWLGYSSFCFGCRPFWIQQNHGVNVLKLLVAIVLEVCEGVCWILQCLCLSKKSSSSPLWSLLTITNPCIPVVFNFYGLHHRPSTFEFLWFHLGGGGPFDKNGSFHFVYQNNN
jgi:hypothetical protein